MAPTRTSTRSRSTPTTELNPENMDPLEDATQNLKPGSKITLDCMITLMRAQNASLKAHYEHLLSEKDAVIESLSKRTRDLELKYDRLEQCGRRNTIRIRGIPEPDKATKEKTDAEVIKLADKLQISVTQSDINISHRVGTKRDQQSRDILVTFVSNNAKSQFMMSRRKLKGSDVYVNEDLTRARALLFSQTRSLKRQKKKIRDTWTITGAIFVKLFDSKIRKVVSDEHDQELCEHL